MDPLNILEYKVLNSRHEDVIEREINAYLNMKLDGQKWIPQGGISHLIYGSRYNLESYKQAMILVKIEKKEIL